MKRLIKLLSIFGVLIILGSCSSSKSVNVSVNEISDNKISVIFYVDRAKFSDMGQTGDDYNSDITMYLRNVTEVGETQPVQLEENITLNKGDVYELSGRYDSVTSVGTYVTFTPCQFTAEISNDTAQTLKVIMKKGYLSLIPI